MFKELNDNLTSIEEEISKLKKAVEHIEMSKSAAESVVNAAKVINTVFIEHTQKVTKAVDAILVPHQELIEATEKLTKTIEAIDFPNQLKIIQYIALGAGAISLITSILVLINNLK